MKSVSFDIPRIFSSLQKMHVRRSKRKPELENNKMQRWTGLGSFLDVESKNRWDLMKRMKRPNKSPIPSPTCFFPPFHSFASWTKGIDDVIQSPLDDCRNFGVVEEFDLEWNSRILSQSRPSLHQSDCLWMLDQPALRIENSDFRSSRQIFHGSIGEMHRERISSIQSIGCCSKFPTFPSWKALRIQYGLRAFAGFQRALPQFRNIS